ncbi:MAG: hypothetical protein NPIRA02_37550 [Nitrospirales bacterium]|nr:MAG: hypothetical protein NPIRA02_37550 [Nitrospirales bacterium]
MRGRGGDSKKSTLLLTCSIILFASSILMSCSHWRDRYFDNAVDDLTQFDIREKFGKPHIIEHSLLDKNTTWVYRVAIPEGELDPSGLKGFGSGVADVGEAVASLVGKGDQGGAPRERIVCLRYELVFDEERILREWTRQFCQLKKSEDPFGRRER